MTHLRQKCTLDRLKIVATIAIVWGGPYLLIWGSEKFLKNKILPTAPMIPDILGLIILALSIGYVQNFLSQIHDALDDSDGMFTPLAIFGLLFFMFLFFYNWLFAILTIGIMSLVRAPLIKKIKNKSNCPS